MREPVRCGVHYQFKCLLFYVIWVYVNLFTGEVQKAMAMHHVREPHPVVDLLGKHGASICDTSLESSASDTAPAVVESSEDEDNEV